MLADAVKPAKVPEIKIEEFKPNKVEQPKPEKTEDKGWLSKAWHTISDPLTDIPSQIGRQLATDITTPVNEDESYLSGVKARAKGFVGGALEGLGGVVSGLTSPLNLATTALTGGSSLAEKQGLSSIAKALNLGSRVTGLPTAIHGAGEVISPDSTLAQRASGLAEIAGGMLGMREHVPATELPTKLTSEIPKVEPQTSKPSLPMGTNIIIKSDKATPISVKKAREAGFEFDGLTDQGHFRFKKTSEPTTQPLLETEVGNTRPKLGPDTDVKKDSMLAEAANFPRTVMASEDMSAPLRQGFGLIHKKGFWKAIPDMVKSWGSEAAYNASQAAIAEKPLFKARVDAEGKALPSFAEDAGLKLTDLTDLTKREESMMSSWAEKVPGVRPSNRSYTTFLNKLRADTFESLINDGKVFGANGEVNIPLAREIANFVNTATGRGSLGKLENSAVALNTFFFAPRLIASRLQMLNPVYYTTAHPFVRKEALKSLFAIAATGNVVGQLAKMSGLGTVETNPNSADYGKIKIGNTRIDPYAGFQQYIVAANRIMRPEGLKVGHETNTGVVPIDMTTGMAASGGSQIKSSTSNNVNKFSEAKFGRPTRKDTLERLAVSKLNPILGFVYDMLKGKDFEGQPFNLPEEVATRFVPLFLQDLKTLVTENPNLIPDFNKKGLGMGFDKLHPENLPLAIPGFFGMGTQQYGPQPRRR